MKNSYENMYNLDCVNKAVNDFGNRNFGNMTHRTIDDYIAQFTTLVQIARDSSTDGNIPDDTMNAKNKIKQAGDDFRDHSIRRVYNAMNGKDGIFNGKMTHEIQEAAGREIDK